VNKQLQVEEFVQVLQPKLNVENAKNKKEFIKQSRCFFLVQSKSFPQFPNFQFDKQYKVENRKFADAV
jgi:hypothetical protein